MYTNNYCRVFNTGSPYNVVAGSGARNMDALVAHYEKLNVEESERKVKESARKEAFFAERAAIREARKSWIPVYMNYSFISSKLEFRELCIVWLASK